MFCTECNNTIYSEDTFCRVCGADILPLPRQSYNGSSLDAYNKQPRNSNRDGYTQPVSANRSDVYAQPQRANGAATYNSSPRSASEYSQPPKSNHPDIYNRSEHTPPSMRNGYPDSYNQPPRASQHDSYNQPPRPSQPDPYNQPPRPSHPDPYNQPPRPSHPDPYNQPPRPNNHDPYNQPPRPNNHDPYNQPPRPNNHDPYNQPPRPSNPTPYNQPPKANPLDPYNHPPRPAPPDSYTHPPRPSHPDPYSQPQKISHHKSHPPQRTGRAYHPDAEPSRPDPPPSKNGGTKKAAIIAACIAVFALGLSIGALIMLRNNQNENGQPPGETYGTPPPAQDNDNETDLGDDPYTQPTPPPDNGYQETQPPDEVYEPEPYRSTRFPFPGTMHRYGDHPEADIFFLQNTLNTMRRYFTSIRHIDMTVDGFSAATFGAVVDFQLRMELPPTGIVNEETWYRLMYAFENRPEHYDQPFEPPVEMWYYTLVRLHLRAAPSTQSDSLGIKEQGTAVWVVSYHSNDSWFFVSTEEGYTGYMKAEFLMREGVMP